MPISHGNSKERKPFHPTWPSTLQRIKEESSTNGPKATVEIISSEVSGMLGASSSGQLPRNEKQVANVRGKGKMSSLTNSEAIDDLFVIMQEAHTQDSHHKFVRDIKTSPEPAIANDQQLQDLVNFGTSSQEVR